MESEYWIGRWQRGETGWHQSEVEPALIKRFAALAPTLILVPLCGKSLDVAWLASQGHQVVGVELSTLAIEAFFSEHKLHFEKSKIADFTVYRSQRITIFNGDIFKFTPELLEGQKLGAIYDRAALIALPPELRQQYVEHLKQLIARARTPTGFEFLQIVLERSAHDNNGPPFSVTVDEVKKLYGNIFEVELLSREEVSSSIKTAGQAFENVLNLKLK